MKAFRILNKSCFLKRLFYKTLWALPEGKIKSWALARSSANDIREALKESISTDSTVLYIGANDGFSGSCLAEFLWRFRKTLTAVLVEPGAEAFLRLSKNYVDKGYANVTLVKAAVVQATLSEASLVKLFKTTAKLTRASALYDQMASLKPEHVIAHSKHFANTTEVTFEAVPTVTMFQLLGDFSPDVVVMDVEGLEYDLLKDLVWTKSLPRLVVFEHCHLTEVRRRSILEILQQHGYTVTFSCDTANAICRKNL
jgi:FkbM family methyltransferase